MNLRGRWSCPACLRHYQRALRPHDSSTASLRKDTGHILPPSCRPLHTTRPALEQSGSHRPRRQAVPVGDFYTDLLSSPLPRDSHSHTETSDEDALPTFVRSGDQTKEERAKKLFGTIHGSGYRRRVSDKPDATWRTVNGVPIPPRPDEPDNCCMSGCVHCVWDDYRDEVEEWALRLRKAQAKSPTSVKPKMELARPEVSEASGSMDADGGGRESLWDTPSTSTSAANAAVAPIDEEVLFQTIPVGIREFMATEKRIRDRQRARKEKKKARQEDEAFI